MIRDRRELTINRKTGDSDKSRRQVAVDGYDTLDQAKPDRLERDGLTEPAYPSRWRY